MGLDDLFCNGETKTGSFFVFSSGEISLIEAVPYQFETILWNTNSIVFYRYQKLVGLLNRLYLDRGVLVAELNCIIDQIVENLLNLDHISIDVHLLPGQNQLNGNEFAAAGAFKRSCCILDDRIDIKISPIQYHTLCIQIIQSQQGIG